MSNNNIKATKINDCLTVITEYQPHALSATIGIWTDGGADKEDKNNNGIAHVLEHMLFKGTPTRNKTEIVVGLESLGAYLNAYTSFNSVAYYFSIAPSKIENVKKASEILLDMFLNSTFPQEELVKEKDVVLQELCASQDDLHDQCYLGFQKEAYGDCYLGRDILGPKENIVSFTSEDLKDFMQSKYKKIYFIAVGNINEEEIIKQLKDKSQDFVDFFKEDTNPTKDLVVYNKNPVVHTQVKKWASQAHCMMGWESVECTDERRHVAQVISCILGGNMSSILCQIIRDEMGLVYSISSYTECFKDSGYMLVDFATFNDKIDLVIETVHKEMEKFMDFTDEQLANAKTYIMGSRIKKSEDNRSRAFFIGEHFIKQGVIKDMEEYINACEKVTREDIRDYWENYLNKPADKISKILTN